MSAIDDLDFDEEDDYGVQRETRCRDCKSTEVYWAETRGHWVLYDFLTSRRHQCKAEHVTADRLDAFENME